ncbi:MAG TPA: polyphosphate kinase 2 family protein [Bryobacteraceae bacterium]|jgi:PPK2 family polyphosphate:nucleotide phosphotransferase|nr:polyphosphate kinase 2 family protein [Bryobacteraceae bacterium]
MKDLEHQLAVPSGKHYKLSSVDPAHTFGIEKAQAVQKLDSIRERLGALQYMLYAEGRRSLLVVLQGIDAGGKDGSIKHVMTGMNPQGVAVTAFKQPEGPERRHDYLWRVHNAVPEYGKIGIFNRSHYEDVLVVRVHDLVPKAVWSKRYQQINDFERMLTENSVTIVKFLLYISKEEQARRFRARIEDKSKNWKFSEADLRERGFWDQYIDAFNDALRKCNTPEAPWYVIPADKKWFRNYAIAHILVETLKSMKLQMPKPEADLSHIEFE